MVRKEANKGFHTGSGGERRSISRAGAINSTVYLNPWEWGVLEAQIPGAGSVGRRLALFTNASGSCGPVLEIFWGGGKMME